MPLKIALLKNTFHSGGGLEKYCLRLLSAFERRGHSVTILTSSSRKDIPVTQVCSRLQPSALGLLWFDLHCRRYLKRNPHDIIFGFDRHFLPLTHYRAGNGCHAAYLARRSKGSSWLKKVSLTLNPLHLLTLLSERSTFERSPPLSIICNSRLVRQELFYYYPKIPIDRLVVIHNGVEWEEYEPHFEHKITSHTSSSQPNLLFIGHEWERKGLDRLLNALSLLKEVPFHLTAVGREKNPERYHRLAEKFNLGSKVTFVPTAQSPIHYYKIASIAIIPSLYDPFANVTLEALAMGLFVITTSANGGSEAIISGFNGIILDENASSEDLANAIASGIRRVKDPSLPFAIRNSIKNFDFSKKLQEFITLVEEDGERLSPSQNRMDLALE